MVSAYGLEPYSPAYIDNVLADLARDHVPGVIYSDLGQTQSRLAHSGSSVDALALNHSIFRAAKAAGAGLWLQLRVYGNQLSLGDAQPRNLTAEEILASPQAAATFMGAVKHDFSVYNESFSSSCRVIVFEEAGIYHQPQGGGLFWSSSEQSLGHPTSFWDGVFAKRFAGVFSLTRQAIRSVNPSCSVGAHIGHSALNNPSPLEAAFHDMGPNRPDFVYYDFYLKSQPDSNTYFGLLAERGRLIEQGLNEKAYFLGQLHTMNAFQHGGGRTPSKAEIDATVQHAREDGFSAIGFYTKNALPTEDFSNTPLDPNANGQSTVYESSKDRWDYGLLKLIELEGVNFRNMFDLVVRAQPGGRVFVRNIRTGSWELVGVVEPSENRRDGGLTVFRDLNSQGYIRRDGRLEARVDAPAGGTLQMWVVPSEPDSRFRSVEQMNGDLRGGVALSGSRAYAQGGSGAPLVLQVR